MHMGNDRNKPVDKKRVGGKRRRGIYRVLNLLLLSRFQYIGGQLPWGAASFLGNAGKEFAGGA